MQRFFISLFTWLLLGLTPTTGMATTAASVTLPLADYLALTEHIEDIDRRHQLELTKAEPGVAEVVEENRRIVIGDQRAEISSVLEVEIRGDRLQPVSLPVTGALWAATVAPEGPASLWRRQQDLAVAVTEPGRYTVEVSSSSHLTEGVGVQQLLLAPISAAVATTEIDLPAELGWSCQGAVVASDETDGDRRTLRLAFTRNRQYTFELRREVRGGVADEVLAKSVVVTMLAVHKTGTIRHDVILYEVARGALAELQVDLPPGLQVDRLASDEGELPAMVDGSTLLVQRQSLLTGTGFLVISSTIDGNGDAALTPVEPKVTVRSRYLTINSEVAATVVPSPTDRWLRVDLGDLPQEVHAAADRLELSTAWRWQGEVGPASVNINRPEPARFAETVIEDRATTTLLTVDGTLLHRDRLTVTTAASSLTIELDPGATLWSSQVDGVAVRPLERHGATVIPLPFGSRRTSKIELVVVQQQAVSPGRSVIDLGLPVFSDPVLSHHWRLILPEDHRYRFAGGDLEPAMSRRRNAAPWQPAETRSTASNVVNNSGGTGAIRGTVMDNEAISLPGVTVTMSSDRLPGGPQVAYTGVNGQFAFNLLPAGMYRVMANLPGFAPAAADLRVRGHGTSSVVFNMVPEQFGGEIEVVAMVPVVDTAQVNTSVVFDLGGLQGRSGGGGSRKPRARQASRVETSSVVNQAAGDLDALSQGLVGGVRPVPVTFPERGKAFDLEGALPPSRVSVQLQVKAGKGK